MNFLALADARIHKIVITKSLDMLKLRSLLAIVCCVVVTQALNTACGQGQIFQLQVPATVPWTDTGVDIVAGSQLVINATGTVYVGDSFSAFTGPEGITFFTAPSTVLESAVLQSLIGKVGGTTAVGTGTPVPAGIARMGLGYVGASYNQQILTDGRLYLGFNDYLPGITPGFSDNSGAFDVTVSVILVPEPSTVALATLGILLHHSCQRRRTLVAPK